MFMKKNYFFQTAFSLLLGGMLMGMPGQAKALGIQVLNPYNQTLEPESYYVSEDASQVDGYYYKAPFSIGQFTLSHYWSDMGFGGGFTYSNCTDRTTPGFNNLSAYAEPDMYRPSYFIANTSDFTPATITRVDGGEMLPASMEITNAAYTALSMLNGDTYAKKFGGADGTDPDWLKLIVTGHKADGATESVEVYLADYRSDDPSADYILDQWISVNLNSLGAVVKLSFRMESSDMGDWGMNTPSYFCMDQLVFNTTEGIEDVSAGAARVQDAVRYADGMLTVKNLADTKLSVMAQDGTLLRTLTVDSDAFTAGLDLMPGVYIVCTELGSTKILVEE